jgi:DNA-binding NarL/FixJ family response regulator
MTATTVDKTRILLLDDHALLRDGVVRLLEPEPDFEMLPPCGSIEEALSALAAHPVDLVLLDFDLGNERGTEFLRRAREMGFPCRVLVVTAGLSESDAVQVLSEGASGIFLKHSPPDLLARSIRRVMEGETYLDQRYLTALLRAGRPVARPDRTARLTERERDVLRLLLEGLANKEIGAQLGISESSVKSALQQLFEKFCVRTRSQLVRIALERLRDQL